MAKGRSPLRPWPCGRSAAAAAAATLALIALAGCATPSTESGFGVLEQAAQAHLGKTLAWPRSDSERAAVDARVAELLAQPLSVDAAVQIALLNNRGLQASFDQLGIADADRVQAGLLPNPGVRFGRLRQGHGAAETTEIDRSITFDLGRLLTLPLARQIEDQRFEATRGAALMSVLSLAAQTRAAYYSAVAADETRRYMLQVQVAAEAGAELARRQLQAGNWNELQQAREQGFHADAALNLARAEQGRVAAREQLARLLGLWGTQTDFQLPDRLPDLPAQPNDLPDIERTAMAQRVDVQAARLDSDRLARALDLTRTTRFINLLELGAQRNSHSDAPVERGFEISIELPLFDWGTSRVAKAEAIYMQSVNRAADLAVNARSEVRLAYANYRTSHDIARRFRDEIVPLKKRISEQNLLRYNGMLIGVFELLADARSQITTVNGYIEALRDFWLAQSALDSVQIGPAPLGVLAPAKAPVMSVTGGVAAAH
ncbi:MAG: RND transporter [Burkholderiales bacterium PBB1]|nr:MAG: RND transporter [Burkholderiales bacterium PBB1]